MDINQRVLGGPSGPRGHRGATTPPPTDNPWQRIIALEQRCARLETALEMFVLNGGGDDLLFEFIEGFTRDQFYGRVPTEITGPT